MDNVVLRLSKVDFTAAVLRAHKAGYDGWRLSEYGTKNSSERFAEYFGAWLNGRDDLLHPEIVSYFEQILPGLRG